MDDYTNNEFDPATWTLYTKTETIPEFQPYATLPLLLTAILFIIIYRKKLQQPLDNL